MKQEPSKILQFALRYWWGIIFLILFIPGVILSVDAYHSVGANDWRDSIYQTIRLFQFENDPQAAEQLILAKWLLCLAFFWLTFKLFITIVAPYFLTGVYIRWFCRDHVVICGLNEIGLSLIKENAFGRKQIVVITNKDNQLLESALKRNVRVVFGDPTDPRMLDKAGVIVAACLYAITDEDKNNIKIAQNAYKLLETDFKKTRGILKCYVMIKDRELKGILEETALFKHIATKEGKAYFDGVLFNINEYGIKYGISKNISAILSKNQESINILIISLGDKAERLILNLAHCLTSDRNYLRFTIIEDNEIAIKNFRKRYSFLENFVELEYSDSINSINTNDNFSSVFICNDSQIENINNCIPIRCLIGKNQPYIFLLCDEPEDMDEVLNNIENPALSLSGRDILIMNLFENTVGYIIHLDADIEVMAECTHNMWREKDVEGNYITDDSYDKLSEHFKQSNRNQVMDNYIKVFVAFGEPLESVRQKAKISLSEYEKETLAMIEHRRWMIEKLAAGWRYAEKRNNEFKTHPDLLSWDRLSEQSKNKDHMVVELMIRNLNGSVANPSQ